jgi:hypothetical protein
LATGIDDVVATAYDTVIEERGVEYGPHLPTLVRLLEDGYFA